MFVLLLLTGRYLLAVFINQVFTLITVFLPAIIKI
jgi:hypothetical protein